MIVPAYAEQDVIAARIANLRALEYPAVIGSRWIVAC